MKKIKESWRKKSSDQKKEFVLRILKQALFAVLWMVVGSVIGFGIIRFLIFLAIPIAFTFLGYYLGKRSNQEVKKQIKTTKTTNTLTTNKK